MDIKVIRKKEGDPGICYIVAADIAEDKLENALVAYSAAEPEFERQVLSAFRAFIELGTKDTPGFVFTNGNDEDWFIAQVEIKNTQA